MIKLIRKIKNILYANIENKSKLPKDSYYRIIENPHTR